MYTTIINKNWKKKLFEKYHKQNESLIQLNHYFNFILFYHNIKIMAFLFICVCFTKSWGCEVGFNSIISIKKNFKISLQNTVQFYAFCKPLKSILINCANLLNLRKITKNQLVKSAIKNDINA
ncbi:hypothetical protein BpHYR1_002997 [Brachionus plicatilis]|uniref:Uncharacterized protein n=1 Tax=Brachionus plicatilis TaxID=10195 RepID=A0A3M7PJ81_BRAPC|nr:hypothetical protein BpHYR1_002997 [Brachionus plicatilis]